MTDKKDELEPIEEQFEDMRILDELKNSYLNYAMSVIVSRALPDVRDGLKPSQRRILVAMNDLNLGPRSKHRKCAKIVGDTGGNYHPHGDQATYGTLVRLGQTWNMRYTLVDPQGNFGSIDSDPPAAMRYTEARMASPATEMLEDLKHDTVDYIPNYDETRDEPTVLPGKFPNLLVNGCTGIAVGMATNMAPHNVSEVCDALLMVLDKPDCEVREIMAVMPGPDFPTGGLICGRKGIYDAYTTGRGHLCLRGKIDIEETGRGRVQIIVTEIPYMVVKTNIVSKIADHVRSGQLPEVSDVRDESDRHGLRIVVDVKKDCDPDVVLNKLYRFTQLQNTFAIANIALVNGRPEVLAIKDMLQCYLEHRKDVIRRRTQYLLKRAQNRAHILEGLIMAVSDIDEIIEIIKRSPDAPTAKLNLMKKALCLAESETLRNLLPEAFVREKTQGEHFLSGPQADAILTMQLQRLTGLEIEKLAKEYCELAEKITGYEAILNDITILLAIVRADIHEIQDKYRDERRSKIVESVNIMDDEDLIAEEEVIVTVSHSGYIKRMPIDTYRTQGRGGRGIIGSDTKEGDFIEHLFVASTHDYLLFFTNRGKCYWLKVYGIPSLARQSKGRSIVNLLNLGDQKIMSIINVSSFENHEEGKDRQLVLATQKGVVKKTPLAAYSNPRTSGVIAINLDEDDDLIGVAETDGNHHILLGTRRGMTIRFDEEQARSMGRTSRGVRGIKLRGEDEVVGMVVALADEEQVDLLTVTENGYGKRTNLSEYRCQSRGGLGLIDIKTTDRNGMVVVIKPISPGDDLMMITAQGMIIRTSLDDVRSISRNTQGLRMINLKEGDKLVAAEVIPPENEEENAEGETQETDTEN
jgi:DNA gyrase subunit A